MKVLIVNKFYYPRGGDCMVAIATRHILQEHGHDVRIYAMDYPENLPMPEEKTYASRVCFGNVLVSKIKASLRTLGQGDINTSFKKVLSDFKPDIVHLHNIHSYLSPAVARIAHEAGIRVVWTLHDYKLACPSYNCLYDGKPCQACFSNKWEVVSRRCMKSSLAASAIAWVEAKKWDAKKLNKYTDKFICPSRFMAEKMKEGGLDASKLAILPNCIDPAKASYYASLPKSTKQDYYCYVGRLSQEKGIKSLLEAAAKLPHMLKIAGGGPLEDELKDKYRNVGHIQFLGHLQATEVSDLLASAKFSILPSEWYENNPLGIIESLCAGTPVAGAAIGGIPELIHPGNGMTFTPGSIQEIKETILAMHQKNDFDYEAISRESLKKFNTEKHYHDLIHLYKKGTDPDLHRKETKRQ